MKGIMVFSPPETLVGKKKEFKTRKTFLEACLAEGHMQLIISKCGNQIGDEKIGESLVRYFPKGTEDSRMEYGPGEGIYQFVDRKGTGVFEVWCL
jgi:hypothetical protein